ncbi:MAG: hypothetical protein ACREJX_10140, partial [Polyangiaceae bacterium]
MGATESPRQGWRLDSAPETGPGSAKLRAEFYVIAAVKERAKSMLDDGALAHPLPKSELAQAFRQLEIERMRD